jgi:hypothetical protein
MAKDDPKDDPKGSDLDWKVLDRQTDGDGDYTVTWSVTAK